MTEESLLRPLTSNGSNCQQLQQNQKQTKKKGHTRRSNNHKKKALKLQQTSFEAAKEANDRTPLIRDPRTENASSVSDTQSDPTAQQQQQRLTAQATKRGTGRNTESFDPSSTWVRPALRVRVGSPHVTTFDQPLRHDDVVIVPELFGEESNWDMYYQLLEEMKDRKDWSSWHEGAHLIVKKPDHSPTFQRVVQTLCDYFQIRPQSLGVRFNWYKDSSDWKPFHHDSAAFNPQRAKSQNITVGASFGACRELAFLLATQTHHKDDTRVYFPQPNNGVFSFGRDVNIRWKHGINAVKDKPEENNDKGRISIIVWGLAQNVMEEEGSPSLLGSDGQGPHAAKINHHTKSQHVKTNRPRNRIHRKNDTSSGSNRTTNQRDATATAPTANQGNANPKPNKENRSSNI